MSTGQTLDPSRMPLGQMEEPCIESAPRPVRTLADRVEALERHNADKDKRLIEQLGMIERLSRVVQVTIADTGTDISGL